MLVLTRKLDESVIVGSDIEIKVLGVRGDQVSLGFSAPGNISIFRKEIFDTMKSQNLEAAREGEGEAKGISESLAAHLEADPPDDTSS